MISTSSCPTPTVSMMMTSLPAASSTSAASAVARASPPRCPRVAMLRMNTPSSATCVCMRRRSPSTAPPLKGLVGSTAMMPTVRTPPTISVVRRSTSVLLPAPGGPVTPTRYARPVWLKMARRAPRWRILVLDERRSPRRSHADRRPARVRQAWESGVFTQTPRWVSMVRQAGAAHRVSSWRAMTSRWISLVPSPIVVSFTSRKNFSAG